MSENETTNEINPEILREKLMYATEIFLPKMPELLNQAKESGEMDMGTKTLMNMFQPFLPKLQTLVINAIEDADEERLLELASKIEDVSEWLQDNELPE